MKINLKKIREEKKLSQTALASLAEISQNYISEIESGNKTPTLDMLEKIADAMEICISLLLVNDKDCSKCYRHKDKEAQDEGQQYWKIYKR
ncbi:TPA: helix-turn-helix domain-containing protein [Clostridium sporogenes]